MVRVSTCASARHFRSLTDRQTDRLPASFTEEVAPQAVDGAKVKSSCVQPSIFHRRSGGPSGRPKSPWGPSLIDILSLGKNQQLKCQISCKIHNSASLLNISPVLFACVLLVPA